MQSTHKQRNTYDLSEGEPPGRVQIRVATPTVRHSLAASLATAATSCKLKPSAAAAPAICTHTHTHTLTVARPNRVQMRCLVRRPEKPTQHRQRRPAGVAPRRKVLMECTQAVVLCHIRNSPCVYMSLGGVWTAISSLPAGMVKAAKPTQWVLHRFAVDTHHTRPPQTSFTSTQPRHLFQDVISRPASVNGG